MERDYWRERERVPMCFKSVSFSMRVWFIFLSIMCVFGCAVEKIDFDRIEFDKIDFGKKWVECELIYVWIHSLRIDS
jgi:hypothetical protein